MGIGIRELLIILVIVVLIFGTKKLANMGGDLGKAVQNFKKGMAGDEDKKSDKDADPSLPDDSRKD